MKFEDLRKEQLAKVRMPYRLLAGFIFILSVLLLPMLVWIAVTEPFELFLLFAFGLIGLGGYIFGKVAVTGYAPNFLLFSHGHKNDV